MLDALQARWKAVAAFVSVAITNLYAFYQVNQNVTLKAVVTSLIAAIVGGVVVHQVPNKK